MKITDVQVILCSFKYPKDFKFEFVTGRHVKRDVLLVKVFTDEGIVGLGEAHHQFSPEVLTSIIIGKMKPIVMGQDPLAIEMLWERMFRQTIMLGQPALAAISGIDIALWDILGKVSRMPIYKLLGGGGVRSIKAYVGGTTFGFKPINELVEEARQYVGQGFSAIKIRAGQGEKDVELLRAIKEAVGDSVDVMVDANSAYSLTTALKLARKFEQYNAYLFEEPLAPGFHYAYAETASLADAVDIPIASGANLYGSYFLKEVIACGGVDIIQPDVARAGGFSECRKIASIANAWKIQYSAHSVSGLNSIANLHMAAAIPQTISSSFEWDAGPYNAPRDDLLTNPPRVENGHLVLPDGPGLGTELNEEVVSRNPYIPGPGWIRN